MSNILYYPVDQSGITTENWANYTDMNNMTNIYSNVEYNIEQTKQDNDNLITLKNNLLKLLNEDNDELIKEEIEKELKEKFLDEVESKNVTDDITLRSINKFKQYQILLHPDEWSQKGLNEKKNLISLIKEEKLNFTANIDKEYKTFKKYFKKDKWKKI